LENQKEISLGDYDKKEDRKGDQVKMYTIHASKGKEFDHVILYDIEEKDIKSIDKDEEEERRIIYVGMTRAIKSLFVTTNKGNISHFVKEMVFHSKYKGYSLEEIEDLLIRDKREKDEYQDEISSIDKNIMELQLKYDKIEKEIKILEDEIRELKLKRSEALLQFEKWNEYIVPKPICFFKKKYAPNFLELKSKKGKMMRSLNGKIN
jgi:hypothetical protein